MKLDRYKIHDIEIVIDRIQIKNNEHSLKRLKDSIVTSMYHGQNSLIIINEEDQKIRYLSKNLVCPNNRHFI